jgi:uncharacterized protein (UPF0332 family)
MSFDWRDFINLARILLRNDQEAYLRTSIGRAYYGVFCIARNKKGFNGQTRNVHQTVINAFKNSNDLLNQKIGKNLDELRWARVKSDYQEDKVIKKSYAERMVSLSENILKILDTI